MLSPKAYCLNSDTQCGTLGCSDNEWPPTSLKISFIIALTYGAVNNLSKLPTYSITGFSFFNSSKIPHIGPLVGSTALHNAESPSLYG